MQRIISASLFLHPGFLIVDHIHFQYNGFMFGILMWSLLMARNVWFRTDQSALALTQLRRTASCSAGSSLLCS